MCRGENAPNPDAGSSQDGGATPPPSPPRPQSQSPVSLSVRSSASTTDEEEARERERRKNKFYYENYSEYQISPDMWGENGDNSGDSAGKRLGHKEKVREEEQRKERMDYENYDDYKIYWDHNIGDLFLGHELSQISLDLLSDNGDNCSDSATEMGDKELLTALFPDFDRGYDIFWQKITLLSEKYEFFRRAARDGNCFYRAFIFSYLEHVLEIQDDAERRSEVKHLRQCIEKAKEAYGSLGSALMFDAQWSTFDGFEYLVDLIQSGLSAGQLYLVDKTDKIISSILPSLKLLIEIELCTQEDFYNPFLSSGEYGSVRECLDFFSSPKVIIVAKQRFIASSFDVSDCRPRCGPSSPARSRAQRRQYHRRCPRVQTRKPSRPSRRFGSAFRESHVEGIRSWTPSIDFHVADRWIFCLRGV
ncbi:uncharacterized protein LOC133889064 [Phragmites australis]|uniref:uncharacterized protein LOC133889064 n=1 Tax=Phragmites australis TaxID=29695 RepID=UPI002D77EA37|nr:uncharacterized protein LOC133889064 [Phragmites australis]